MRDQECNDESVRWVNRSVISDEVCSVNNQECDEWWWVWWFAEWPVVWNDNESTISSLHEISFLQIVTRQTETGASKENMRHLMLTAAQNFGKSDSFFRLFYEYFSSKDLLFKVSFQLLFFSVFFCILLIYLFQIKIVPFTSDSKWIYHTTLQ